MFQNDRKLWLRYGPGGWAPRPRARARTPEESAKPIDLRHLPQWRKLRRALIRQVESAPALRQPLADAFAAIGKPPC